MLRTVRESLEEFPARVRHAADFDDVPRIKEPVVRRVCVGLQVAAVAGEDVAGSIAAPPFSEVEDDVAQLLAEVCPEEGLLRALARRPWLQQGHRRVVRAHGP